MTATGIDTRFSPTVTRAVMLSLLALFVRLASAAAASPGQVPVLRANSPLVDIRDGNRFRKGEWRVSPDIALDIYEVRRSAKKKTVTFTTDVDSLSFEVEPGKTYDFDILLNGTRTCHTRISNSDRAYRRAGQRRAGVPDVVPFTLARDGKMHIQGTLNGSRPLDLIFDTGADTVVLFPSALAKKAKIAFDGVVQNSGFGGITTRQTSSNNRLQIASLSWKRESVLYIEKQADEADGVVGYTVFEDKVIEIDYDRSCLLLHEKLPENRARFAPVDTRFPGSLPEIRVTLDTGKKKVTDWLVVDTGANGGLNLNQAFCTANQLYDTMTRIGTSHSSGVGTGVIENALVVLPRLTLGTGLLQDVPTNLELPTQTPFVSSSTVGMGVLKYFNLLIDCPQEQVYAQRNQVLAEVAPKNSKTNANQ